MTWVWLGLRDSTFRGGMREGTTLCRCCIQGTWFSINKRPGLMTTYGHGVGRGVIFLGGWKQLGFIHKKERLEINKNKFTHSQVFWLDQGKREGIGWGRNWKSEYRWSN